MPTFVTTVLDNMSSTTIAFVQSVVTNYWPTILGVGLIFVIGSMFLRLGRFGRH